MRVRIILQARTTSSRLPAKVLLPVGGLPLAVLCAKRLGRDGLEVVLATSVQPSDDYLAKIAAEHGVAVHRGPLEDVLTRFVECAGELADDDLIVRVTADNPVPDADFVRTLLQAWQEGDAQYLGTSSPADGLPYGVSAELFTVAALRAAHAKATASFDREHVTPWIRRNVRSALFDGRSALREDGLERLRCTIDTPGDYQNAIQLFEAVSEDPVEVNWRTLVATLKDMPFSASFRVPYRIGASGAESMVCLGTAQLGMHYGATNRVGMPAEDVATELLQSAISHGVTWIDTASAYGLAEARVGKALASAQSSVRIVTKLSPLTDLPSDVGESCVSAAVDASVFRSLYALQRKWLDVLLLHRWAHRAQYGGAIWRRLQELKLNGVIRELGASVYTPAEAVEALEDPDVTHLQLPFNLLDHRWRDARFRAAIDRRRDVRIHVRSVFLQGLLLNEAANWPAWEGNARHWVQTIDQLVAEFGRSSRADLCLAYVMAQPWVDAVVLGVDTPEQLVQTLRTTCNPALDADEVSVVEAQFVGASDRLLNPSKW